MDNSKICPAILELRLQHGYTQKYVAEYIGVSLSQYRRYEKVNSKCMRMDKVEKLAMLYHTTIPKITGWDKL